MERVHGAPELRRVLGAPESAEAREEHHACGAHRWRMVRRGGFLRPTRDLQGRGTLLRQQEPHRHRAVASWRLGVDAGRCTRRCSLRVEHRRVLPQRDRAAVLQVSPERTGHRAGRGSHRVRDRRECMEDVRYVAAKEHRHAHPVLPGRRRPLIYGAGGSVHNRDWVR